MVGCGSSWTRSQLGARKPRQASCGLTYGRRTHGGHHGDGRAVHAGCFHHLSGRRAGHDRYRYKLGRHQGSVRMSNQPKRLSTVHQRSRTNSFPVGCYGERWLHDRQQTVASGQLQLRDDQR
uniref:(northern house mosquito) hypothetical protein n=1 Tax=Culex pipiens TaxID=7175 RepID=A0A8D8FCD2_CULPI